MKIYDWHARYILQALWTANLRRYLLAKINLPHNPQVLDVGCGTGALFPDLYRTGCIVTGLDYKFNHCNFAMPHNPERMMLCADALTMPIQNGVYDVSLSHYFLMWVKNPLKAITEMRRVTKPGGYVMAFAEPDYSARIDYPEIFKKIGIVQNRSLQFQGVDLEMGRQLSWMFRQAGLNQVQVGLLAGEWKEPNLEVFLHEWEIIAHDMGGLVPIEDILAMKEEGQAAWLSGQATVFIPTFYAYGMV